MAKLVLSFNGDIVREYELDRGSLTIGRDQGNDILIDNPAVSSKHAKVLTILNESFIEDLDSTNGTYFNGNKISGHALHDGDSIFIGEHELNYSNDKMDNATNKSAANSSLPETKDPDSVPEKSATEKLRKAKLQIISEPNAGKELPLNKTINTLGRADVQVAAVSRRADGYYLIVIDAGENKKGPMVNDSEIGKQQLLADGDTIEVAGVQMKFNYLCGE